MATVIDLPRVLDLEGGLNVRDLGGYRTEDGRTVKWRKLFRSGSPAKLSARDMETLAGFGIRALCDLRTNEEREMAPSVWQTGGDFTYWSRECSSAFGELRGLMASQAPTADLAREAMLAGYRRLPFQQAPAYREIFRRMKAGELPIMWNCSAGKDRAGTGAALILTALGVPREIVIEDYLITNQTLDIHRLSASKPDGKSSLSKQPPEVTQIVLSCDAIYLDAAFAAIDAQCGGFSGYLKDYLDVSEADLAALKDALLD